MSPLYSDTGGLKEFGQGFTGILKFLVSPELQGELLPLKIIFIFITFLFFFIIFYLLTHTGYLDWLFFRYLKNFLLIKFFGSQKIAKEWQRIKQGIKTGPEGSWKAGVMQASNLLDGILKKMGYNGASLEERIISVGKEDVSNLEDLNKAARICQDIARDPDYLLPGEKAEEIMEIFEKALKELEVI